MTAPAAQRPDSGVKVRANHRTRRALEVAPVIGPRGVYVRIDRRAIKGDRIMSTKIAAIVAALLITLGLPACANTGSGEDAGGDTGGQEQESGTDDGGY